MAFDSLVNSLENLSQALGSAEPNAFLVPLQNINNHLVNDNAAEQILYFTLLDPTSNLVSEVALEQGENKFYYAAAITHQDTSALSSIQWSESVPLLVAVNDETKEVAGVGILANSHFGFYEETDVETDESYLEAAVAYYDPEETLPGPVITVLPLSSGNPYPVYQWTFRLKIGTPPHNGWGFGWLEVRYWPNGKPPVN